MFRISVETKIITASWLIPVDPTAITTNIILYGYWTLLPKMRCRIVSHGEKIYPQNAWESKKSNPLYAIPPEKENKTVKDISVNKNSPWKIRPWSRDTYNIILIDYWDYTDWDWVTFK